MYGAGTNTVYVDTDPTSLKVEVTTRKDALVFKAGSQGSIVRGIGVKHYGTELNFVAPLRVNEVNNVTIENNLITDNSLNGVYVRGHAPAYNDDHAASC